ncbi:hypothetical protein Hanom_Chr05g00465351 [Helianthus anomalus]
MQILPTQRQSWYEIEWLLWLQLQTLIWVSSVDLSAVKAWRTVADTDSDFNGGLPRQRSATSCANKRAAIQWLNLKGVLTGGVGVVSVICREMSGCVCGDIDV